MNTDFKWTDNLVAEFIQSRLHIVDSASFDLIEQFKESKQRRKLFTTKDTKDIYVGDYCWAVRKCYFYINSFTADTLSSSLNDHPEHNEWWYFSSEETASEWILFNKPLVSLNEIKRLGQITTPDDNIYFKRLVEAAKANMNK